ncbi:MAG: 30S ribosomal protein S6 [Clostridiaceae bacterium]|nr:30S ribosomal protein S6 [Clostridiaceae bacterium]
MEKKNANYETIFIVNAELSDEVRDGIVTKFKTLIGENAEITKIDEWGKRRMAYAINDMHEGYYVFVSFVAPQAFPAELDRVYKITDGILRSLIVNIDE